MDSGGLGTKLGNCRNARSMHIFLRDTLNKTLYDVTNIILTDDVTPRSLIDDTNCKGIPESE